MYSNVAGGLSRVIDNKVKKNKLILAIEICLILHNPWYERFKSETSARLRDRCCPSSDDRLLALEPRAEIQGAVFELQR